MYNLYTTSTVSLRTRASPSFSLIDHPSYSISPSHNARHSSSSSCCNCNCCCSLPVNCVPSCGLVPLNPTLTYGFRQSTLIQWPSSRRRFFLTSADRCAFDDPGRARIPCRRLCCIKDAGADRRKDGSILKEKGIELWGYRKRVFQERLVFRRIASACEDAEAMISLLTDEVGKELLCLNGRAKDNAVKGKCNYRKGNELECEEAENRKESYRTRRWEDDLGRDEYSRLTKQVSADSSYYSCSESGDYESDSEVVVTTHQFLRNSREDDVEERKKYTKKHTGDSFGQAASRKTSNINKPRRSEAHVRAEEASRTTKQYGFRGEESISDLNSNEVWRSGYSRSDKQVKGTSKSRSKYERLTGSSDRVHEKSTGSSKKERVGEENVVSNCEFCATCGQASLGDKRSDSEQRSKFSQIQESNINLVSNIDTQANSRHKRMEERSTLLEMSANEVNQQQDLEHHVASGQMSSQNYTESSNAAQSYEESTNLFRRHVKHFKDQNTDASLTSTAKQQSNTRINRQEATSASLQTSLEDVNEKIHQENLVATSQTNLIRKSQNRSSRENAGVSFIQNSSRTQKEARRKSSEESMAVKTNISSQHAKGGQSHTVTEIGSQNQYTNASEDVSVGSQAHIHETAISNTRSPSRTKSNHKQSYLTESVTSAKQRIEQCEQVEERIKQTDFRYDLEGPRREVSYHENETSNPYRTSTSQIEIEEIGDKVHDGNQARLAPRTQSIKRDPVYAESASRLIKGDSCQSSEGDSSIYIYPQATGVSPSGQEPSQLINHVDLLGSAERQNRSSLQFMGDFVDKARHQASTSASHIEKKLPKMCLVDEESTQSVGENHELRKQYSRRPSSSGTAKRPTEEIWGAQEPRPREGTSQATAAPADSVAERSGRTLWNVIADIALFRWGSRAESNRSPVKSGVKSSSSDSLKSEAWFSGQDPDEAKGSDMNRSTSSRVPESTSTDRPLLIRTPTQSSTEQVTLLSTGDDAGPDVHNAPSSSGGISGETNLELNVEEVKETSQATTSVDWSQPAAGLFRRSHRSYFSTLEMQEGGNEAVGNVRMDQIQDDLNSSLNEASGSGDNAELERRKLLRNKQVVRERFEEWEEAYKVESEQRKMDEIFMREALEEAKKAADIWEVPVGAVLVHDGKIIARGYNLVEDLRDSTAHAEMICIREGSNVLKAWRLSDTTLYVTLEPCAMCAGAILQARIGTLVYGAPNKLLGADGSWIRLFPSSADGDGRSESSSGKAEGPVHPFHTKMTIRRGILETECSDAMQQFFRLRRKKDKKTEQGVQQSSSKKMTHPSKLLNKMHNVFHFLFCL